MLVPGGLVYSRLNGAIWEFFKQIELFIRIDLFPTDELDGLIGLWISRMILLRFSVGCGFVVVCC